ncbi:MAG TPA: MASE1 domain-containing protein [Gemmatimonadaceae bacterium]|nr:MASE1 domain-containing protein [Gemmatimonadaceae bacterium]
MTAFPRIMRTPDAARDAAAANAPVRVSPVSMVWRVVFVAFAYYAGGRIGFLFQSPSVPQSVFWLPNAILLVALLVTPPRRWLLILAGAFPAQMLVAWQQHAPLATLSMLFVTNCADAALAALVWRVASPNDWRIEGLRSMLVLLLVAAVPTLLLSFADAGITVATHWSQNFWLVYETRARANVLTNVIFVPTALALIGAKREALTPYLRSRWVEGALLFAGLLATSAFALSRPTESISSAAVVYLPLVFLLWSAVRFGIGTTAGALLALGYLSTWLAMRGIGNVATAHVPAAIVPALQFQLLAIAVPMLCLSAVVRDRERASIALTASQRALHQSLGQIRNLAGRLLTATEVERARIARDLHDDVSQQLAALGISLSALKRHLPNDPAMREEVAALQSQAMRAADDLRALSHELHPAALRHAGLVPAMAELCSQYGRGDSMRAVLSAKPRDISVSDDVALCVYRVTQEALRNAARHSGAHGALVTLHTSENALDLQIADDGMGFDENAARRRGGLGLTSIDERVRLVGGTVRVDSSPGHGTRISIRVPNGDSHGSAHAVARG